MKINYKNKYLKYKKKYFNLKMYGGSFIHYVNYANFKDTFVNDLEITFQDYTYKIGIKFNNNFGKFLFYKIDTNNISNYDIMYIDINEAIQIIKQTIHEKNEIIKKLKDSDDRDDRVDIVIEDQNKTQINNELKQILINICIYLNILLQIENFKLIIDNLKHIIYYNDTNSVFYINDDFDIINKIINYLYENNLNNIDNFLNDKIKTQYKYINEDILIYNKNGTEILILENDIKLDEHTNYVDKNNNVIMYNKNLKNPWYDEIKSENKIFEGRIYQNEFLFINKDNYINFNNYQHSENKKRNIFVKVTDTIILPFKDISLQLIHNFYNFQSFSLDSEDFKNSMIYQLYGEQFKKNYEKYNRENTNKLTIEQFIPIYTKTTYTTYNKATDDTMFILIKFKKINIDNMDDDINIDSNVKEIINTLKGQFICE